MIDQNTTSPGFNDENLDRDKKLKDDLGNRTDAEDLLYNADKNSYEIDVKSEDPDYQHDFPYNTAAPNGEDFNSTYDEANPEAVDEYIPNESLETDVDNLGMHIDHGQSVELDPIDEVLSRTPEDDRDDLDEEGYPKNDRGIDAEGYPKKSAGDNDTEFFK
ncbi:hypothetical protein [Mucilaginibacter arboris]|uniref:hypothetical protein n=1 Tax=Mucilaginibacter arboris TaxID=2682090 RepID=UPI0018DDEEB0|nr:hypothetical protein [Mucilaginibacter arboris]